MADAHAAAPSDADRVLGALRFGWGVAEVRGRLRTGPPDSAPVKRPERALPLADERTWTEQTIETKEVVTRLAETLERDAPKGELQKLSKALESAREKDDRATLQVRWNDVCEFFYQWDARTQDAFAAESFTVASAYQLGRGLAEVYWALDPSIDAEGDPRSSGFLLGPGRLLAFRRLLPRLSGYFPASTSQAVLASLEAWGHVQRDGLLRSRADAREQLHEQLRVWHDLLLVGQTPEVLIESNDLLSRARRIGPVVREFVPEASIALLSLVAAGAAAILFAVGPGARWLAPLLSVLTVFGITSAGALAKVKGEAHSVFDQLRQAMNADLVHEAVTLPPARAYLDRRRGPLRRRA
jgi:hypothetical protein